MAQPDWWVRQMQTIHRQKARAHAAAQQEQQRKIAKKR
jgi:hypothetical protein